MKKMILLTVFVLTVMLLLTACGNSGQAAVQPLRYAEIAVNTSCMVSEVLVQEGEQVEKGQPLIRPGDESDTDYAAARLELVSAQKALNDLLNACGSELAQAVIDLKDAQEAYDKADDYLRFLQNSKKVPQTETRMFLIQTWKGYEYRYKTKSFKGPAPEDWIIEAENDLALKKAKLEEAQHTYDRLKGRADADQLAVLQARLDDR
jgi:multidrug resistance efflux pump